MSKSPAIVRLRLAVIIVATVAAVVFVPCWAAGQSAPASSSQRVSAHGACGPGHPYVERFAAPPVGVPPPGRGRRSDLTVAARTRRSDLVLVGRVARARAAAGSAGIWTNATFDYPLILKSPPSGPVPGARSVSVRFLGGTALFQGSCTRQYGNDLRPGDLYLVFAGVMAAGRHRGDFVGGASPVEEPSGLLAERSGPRIYFPPGQPDTLAQVVAEVKAEVAREKAAAGGANK